MSDIRWGRYRDAMTIGRLLAIRFPGRLGSLRAAARAIVVPHLVTAAGDATVGVRPRDAASRFASALLALAWVKPAPIDIAVLPVPLRVPSRNWQVVDLASAPVDGSPLAPFALSRQVLRLADAHGATLHVAVAESNQRLRALYCAHGFAPALARSHRASSGTTALTRAPTQVRLHRRVLRTGRTTLEYFEATFGVDLGAAGAEAVLDVGAGDSPIAGELAARGVLAVAVDRDYRWRPLRLDQRHLVTADAAQLPFADRTFDRVLAVFVIQHLRQGPAALRELARVCADQGTIHLHPLWSRARGRRVDRLPGAEVRPGHLLRPRIRPSVTVDAKLTREWSGADWESLASALRPPAAARHLGAAGTALWMHITGTNGPVTLQRRPR